jgi:hypothetical protein
MNRLSLLLATTIASFTSTFHPCSAQTDAPTADEVKAVAEEAYIYGLPLVMAYTASYEFWLDKSSSQYKSPMGELTHSRRVFTYEDTAVIVPNSDTPYSFACLDLRAEPWVVSVPEVESGRYFSVQMVDWNAFNFGYIGSRATGNGAGDFLVVGPEWKGKAPAGIKGVLRSSSQFCIAIIRTQLFGPDDMENVAKIQDGYQVRPLSAFLKQPAPPAAAAMDFPKANAQLAKENFFGLLEFVLQVAPAGPEEKDIRTKLARIGVGPEKMFDFKDLPSAHKAAALEGVKAGIAKVQERQTHQWLANRLALRQPRFLQGRLAAPRRRCAGRHLRQQRGRSGLSDVPLVARWRIDRHFEACIQPDFSQGRPSPSQCVLVGHNVRRQKPVAHPEPDQPLPYQLADADRHEEERRRLADNLRAKRQPWRGQRKQLAPRSRRPRLSSHASLLAELRGPFHSPARQRHVETTWLCQNTVKPFSRIQFQV